MVMIVAVWLTDLQGCTDLFKLLLYKNYLLPILWESTMCISYAIY